VRYALNRPLFSRPSRACELMWRQQPCFGASEAPHTRRGQPRVTTTTVMVVAMTTVMATVAVMKKCLSCPWNRLLVKVCLLALRDACEARTRRLARWLLPSIISQSCLRRRRQKEGNRTTEPCMWGAKSATLSKNVSTAWTYLLRKK